MAFVALLGLRKMVGAWKRAIIVLFGLVAVWVGLSLIFRTDTLAASSLQTGLLDPIPLSVRGALFEGGVATGLAFLIP